MKARRCYEITTLVFPILLDQTGEDTFTVTYGLQIDKDLNYRNAARILGENIMHALVLDNKIDGDD